MNKIYTEIYNEFRFFFIKNNSKLAIENVQRQGKVCVLDIEIQGVEQVRNSTLNPLLVFINPPSVDELERRLRGRNTETEESLQKRLDTARHEMEYGESVLKPFYNRKNHDYFFRQQTW